MTFSRTFGLAATAVFTIAGSAAISQQANPALKEALVPLVASGGSISDFADFAGYNHLYIFRYFVYEPYTFCDPEHPESTSEA